MPNPGGDILLVESAARGLTGHEVLVREELPEGRIHAKDPGVFVRPQAGRPHCRRYSIQKFADALLCAGLVFAQDSCDPVWRGEFGELGQVFGMLRASAAFACCSRNWAISQLKGA